MSYVLEELAPFLGLIFLPSTTQVLLDDAPLLGLSSFPSHSHVFEEVAPDLGLISLPSHIQVLDDEAPLFGFSSRPSQTHPLGTSMFILMSAFHNEIQKKNLILSTIYKCESGIAWLHRTAGSTVV